MAQLIRVEAHLAGSPGYQKGIREAAAIIHDGGLVGFPTETVYGLAAHGLDGRAVARVFEVKQRPLDSALILHLADAAEAPRYARSVPDPALGLMDAFWPGPLTIILAKAAVVPDIVSAGRSNVGMRVPDHQVARDLVRAVGRPIVGPSANKWGRPSPMTAQDVLAELGEGIEAVLDSGPARLGMESTVLDLTRTPPAVLRPGAITLDQLRPYLADVVMGSAHSRPAAARPGAVGEATAGRGLRMRLVLLDEEPGSRAANGAVALAHVFSQRGERAAVLVQDGLLTGDRTAEPGVVDVCLLGPAGDLRAAAARLYPALRECESSGYDVVVAAPVPRQGLGLAIMNRLEKMAAEVVAG